MKQISIVDDLDGSANAKTLEFSYNGASYSIDLASKNQAALEKALKPWIDVATKTSGRMVRRAASKRGGDLAAVRAWATKNGMKVAARGRISADVVAAYEASKTK